METREEIEVALGRKMHEISKEQEIFVASQDRLKELQSQANVLDKKLNRFDD